MEGLMETCLANSQWKCIICEKDMPIEKDFQCDDRRLLPNIEGGTAILHFGYPSRFDQLESMIANSHETCIIAICDDCFDKKCSLAKRILIKESTEYIINE